MLIRCWGQMSSEGKKQGGLRPARTLQRAQLLESRTYLSLGYQRLLLQPTDRVRLNG